MFQYKTLLKQEEDKVKFLEKQLQRETTERRIAEVKLSEIKRSSVATGAGAAVVTAIVQPRGTAGAAANGGKSSIHVNAIHSPPWKHRRKSDPLHLPLHKESNPPTEALAMRTFIPSTNNHSNLGSNAVAKKTAAHVVKEPNNMQHHVDHGITTTDFSNNYPSSLQQGSCLQDNDRQSKACTNIENTGKNSIGKQQCQTPLIGSNFKQAISGSQHQNRSRPAMLHDSTFQIIAIDLLQDITQLTTELSQQLDDYGRNYYYQQTPTSLWNDWEKIKAILCESIEASSGASNTHRSSLAGVQLLIMIVVDMIAHRRSDYIENVTSTTFNPRNRNEIFHYEVGCETTQCIHEDKDNLTSSNQDVVNEISQTINPSPSKGTIEQYIIGLHVLNLLIFLERLVRLSFTARSCLITGLLMSTSTHSSTCRLGSIDEQHLNSKAAANNQNRLHKNQKRKCDFRDDGNSAPFMDVFHRNKRKRIFLTSGLNADVAPQADPYDKSLQLQSSSYHAESLSLFFGWMKYLLFDCNDLCVMATAKYDTTETVRSERPCHPSMRFSDDLILLALLRLISTLICESDLTSDQTCFKNLMLNASQGTTRHSTCDSGNLGEELLARLICSSQSDRDQEKISDTDNHPPDSSKRYTHDALPLVDLMSFVLGRQHDYDAQDASITKCIPDLPMKCSIFQLYRKMLSSACGLAFSHLTMTSDYAKAKGECMLLTLHELDLCLRFLKNSTYSQSKSYTASSIVIKMDHAGVVKLTLNIVEMIVAYLQIDPIQCATFLHRKYQVHRESKLSWCEKWKPMKSLNSRSTKSAQERSGIATLVDCLEYSVSSLLSVSTHGGCIYKMNVEFAHHLGLLIDSETQLFSLLLLYVQRLDHSIQPEVKDKMSSLLQIIGDAKSSFCSSCCLLAQFSEFCPFIGNTSRCVAQCLLEEIKLDEEDAEQS
jgi:hypothetical protein